MPIHRKSELSPQKTEGSRRGRVPVALLAAAWLLTAGAAHAQNAPADLPEHTTTTAHLPAVIDAIEVIGLHRTKLAVVLRELPFVPGQKVDQTTWDFAVKRLWNFGLFADVQADIVKRHGRVTATFRLDERWTLNPLFAFGVGSGVYWFGAGATDSNLGGRFVEAGAQYQRFNDFNGFEGWVRDPRLFDKRFDWMVLAGQLVRPRGDFADRRLRFVTEFAWTSWLDRLRLGARIDVMRTTFLPPDGSSAGDNPAMAWAFAYEASARIGRVDAVRIRQQGGTVELRTAFVSAEASPITFAGDFGQLWLEGNGFVMVGTRWNFAGRFQAGLQGDAPKQLRFYVGGLEQVRGYVDNFARTPRYAFTNLEARFIAWDSTWIAFMPAVFVDGGVVALETGGARPLLSGGAGLRILFPWMVDAGIRIDAAVPLAAGCSSGKSFCPGVNIGLYQFFDGKLKPASR